MLVKLGTSFLGILFFLFIFWKRLKEDYSSDIIFQIASSILLGMGVGFSVSKMFFPNLFFWLEMAGALLGMAIMIFKFKLRFYETLESLILAGMPMVTLMFFKDSIVNSSLYSFLAFIGLLVLIFLAYWLDVNYKSFTWYKSGRIGFAGLFAAIIFFTARSVIAIFGINMLSCVGKIEPYISLPVAVLCVGLLINLGRKTI